MNIYEKLQNCRVELQDMKLKKSGENTYSKFKYYELADFIPQINNLFNKHKLFSNFSIRENMAFLKIINIEKPEEIEVFDSPIENVELKGCTAIQGLGAVHTYMKRYLYLNALEIVENDTLDANAGNNEVIKDKQKKQQQEPQDSTSSDLEILLNECKTENECKDWFKIASKDIKAMAQLGLGAKYQKKLKLITEQGAKK